MNLEELRTEFLARGFHYLPSSRADSYIDSAYRLDICEDEPWFFLEATATGTAPLTISDLRTIEYVIDLTNVEKLQPLLQARITDDWNPDLTETGTPSLYYVTKGTTVNVFPVAADEIQVNYWKVPPKLTGTDEPLLPERWHSLIVDGAVARAYSESDDYELAQAARSEFEARLQQMRESLESQQRDESDDYVVLEDWAALR